MWAAFIEITYPETGVLQARTAFVAHEREPLAKAVIDFLAAFELDNCAAWHVWVKAIHENLRVDNSYTLARKHNSESSGFHLVIARASAIDIELQEA